MPSRAEMYKYAYHGLSLIPAEPIHDFTLSLLAQIEKSRAGLNFLECVANPHGKRYVSERLKANLCGVNYENLFVNAAGFNKNGIACKALYTVGFGGQIVGTVTFDEQHGNDARQRIVRIKDGLINYMGLPNEGSEKVAKNVSEYLDRNYPLGISLGLSKNADLDEAPQIFSAMIEKFYNLVDLFELNLSCLNVKEGNSLPLQNRILLEKIVKNILITMDTLGKRKPVGLKISPDISVSELDNIIDIASMYGLYIIAVNTSVELKIADPKLKQIKGVVSGKRLLKRGEAIISHIHKSEPNLEIVGCGGIDDLSSVLAAASAGAHLFQFYTGFIYKGPTLPGSLSEETDIWMDKHGVNNISEIVGQNVRP